MRTFFLKPIVPDLDNANEGSTILIITFFGAILRKFFYFANYSKNIIEK